jgi:hypothetical protein
MDKRVQVEDIKLDGEVALASANTTVAKYVSEALAGPQAVLKSDVQFATSLIKEKETLGLDTERDKKIVGDLIEESLQNIYKKYDKA